MEGKSAIGPVPPDRWDASAIYDVRRDSPGKTWAREGGFLEHIDRFDAQFFGLSPREAAALDPQTRLVMEVSCEALEDAGQDPSRRARTTGVFVGVSGSDYQDIQLSDRRAIDGYVATGTSLSGASNRVSHALDLHGPSMSVDTACSSALVAVHLAAQSLWTGESDLALAGGVGLLICPEMTIAFSKGFMLAPDMRCKAFDARANGFVRGEGAGMVVLKRLSDARAEADRIYAVLLATAVNQDGFTPQGIAVPNQRAQEAQIETAYRRAGVRPEEVHYVEAHGPGTPVGDPIEAAALGAVLGSGRARGDELVIGSIKTNIGHLEPAAGIAGLIKAALALHEGAIPPNLHFERSNPAIPLEDLGLRVPTSVEPWTKDGKRRVAGVNSFGFGGTNAHAVLAGAELHAPEARPEPMRAVAPWVLPLSARSHAALGELVAAYAAELAESPAGVADLVRGAAQRRAPYAHRVAVVGEDPASLRVALQSWQERASHAPGPRRAAFVFSGMGGQWWAMARELCASEPVFRRVIEEIDRAMQGRAGFSLLGELMAPERESRLTHDFEVGQPAVFALQVALAALWRSLGVEPVAVVGHSVGEIAAAHVAGAITLEDAVGLVITRSELQARAAGLGAMVAVPLAHEQVQALVGDRVSVAVVNSPESTVLAGDRDCLEAIVARLEKQGAVSRWLTVPFAAHSPLMEDAKRELVARMRSLVPATPAIPIHSTVTGARIAGAAHDADYWGDNTRAPVLFVDAVRSMVADGIDVFVEIGPHPVLVHAIGEYGAHAQKDLVAVPSMRRDQPAQRVLRESLARLWSLGCQVCWEHAYGWGPRVRLPRHPWQRQSYWREPEVSRRARRPKLEHPLLGVRAPGPHPTWSGDLGRAELAYMEDHNVQGAVILPGAAFVEMALAAGRLVHEGKPLRVERVRLLAAMFIDAESPAEVRTIFHGGEEERVEICSQRTRGDAFTVHCQASLGRGEARSPLPVDVDALRQRCPLPMTGYAFYDKLARMGDRFGPRFKGVRRLWQGTGEVLAEIEILPEIARDLERYHVHPVVLDALFQTLVAHFAPWEEVSCLPVGIDRLVVHGPLSSDRFLAHARVVDRDPIGCKGDLCLMDPGGRVLIEVSGFTFCTLESTKARHAARRDLLFRDVWEPSALSEKNAKTAGTWLVLAADRSPGLDVVAALERHGARGALLSLEVGASDVAARAARKVALQGDALRGVVFVSDGGTDVNLDAISREMASAVRLVQGLCKASLPPGFRLFWVTQGVYDPAPRLGGSTLWGFARVVANEHPELGSTLIDIDGTEASIDALAQEMLAHGPEDEVRLAREGRAVHRVRRLLDVPCSETALLRRVCIEHLGATTSVTTLAGPLPSPGRGQVLVALRSVALGPWDARAVAAGRGMHGIGNVGVGVVARLGEDVHDRVIGQDVVVLGHGLLATHALVDAALTAAVDAGLDGPTACAAALAALFAEAALEGIEPGEVVCLVGGKPAMRRACEAAARRRGASVVSADAGARSFRVVVHMADSDELHCSVDLVRSGGRLVVFAPGDLGRDVVFEAMSRAIRIESANLPARIDAAPDEAASLLRAAASLLPLDISREAQISPGELGERLERPAEAPWVISPEQLGHDAFQDATFQADATYLIIGGLGGFGRTVAAWMVAKGARHLVLLGRSGANTPGAREALEQLEHAGACITVERADVTNRSELAQALSRLRREHPPIRGVIHSAMVLEDATIAHLDVGGLERVLSPKVRGAFHLHELTADLPLDFFVLFSSFATLAGNPGQAAYAAANAFLEGLARLRRSRGLPGLAIGWGILGGVGYVADREEVRLHLERIGLAPLPLHASLGILGDLLSSDLGDVSACDMDWRRWCASHANGAGPRLGALGRTQVHAGVPATWEQALREAPPERRLACILEGLVVRVARVLGTTPQSLGPGSSLGEFGLDSLMAVELRNRLRQDLGLDLPTLVFLQGPTLSTLAKTIEDRLFAGPAMAPAKAAREVCRDEWFHRPSPRDAAELRLFCFPYNGGGVSTYASWASELPFADVVTLELPGSRDRLDEAPARSWDHLVEQTAAAMEPLMDRPFALYGHSLGGLLAFEVARALEDKGYPPALGLFIGAFPAPMLPSPFPPDASRLLDASDHPLASLDDSGLKDVILRALCAGIEVYGSYRFDSRRKLSCPLVALCGDRDDLVRPDYMLPWEQLTRRGFGLEILRGGHLFVDTARAATLDVLQKYLRTIFRPEGAKNEPDHA